ncbi:MAG: methyltransferase domain-containing protein [Deltaproteobacteria bacterium]|uniref:Methyltransferase domain-containing protein n=1 Tax=Candidatus Zymogenus saltonus TaxID=2844893 RepID=A0A9D8KJU0_9DELT|nr:methyltransferase domain-containing protein [Candidatus Zymogenus saltonus]
MIKYVHGYSERETERLYDQAGSVKDLIHYDSLFPKGSLILEVGCGVGAQTVTLAAQNPDSNFVSIDIAEDSLKKAGALIEREGIKNVEFKIADIFSLPFDNDSFDHVFICYVLEHLEDPVGAVSKILDVVKPGGTVTAIEGDHGSCYFHPETPEAVKAWRCLIEAQSRISGDSLIGRRLYPLLTEGGLKNVSVSPRMIYADRSRPDLIDSFVLKTIIPMVEGVKEQSLKLGLIDKETWEKGIADLYAITERDDGTFCYTFFKAVGEKVV